MPCSLAGSHWDIDEYGEIARYRGFGIAFLRLRLSGWSVRPVSELFLYAYARAVLATGATLIIPCLALLWAILGTGTLLPARPDRSLLGQCRTAAAVSLLSMFLLGHRLDDFVYTPWSSAPYMLALAGFSFACVTVVFADEVGKWARWPCCLGFSFAAASSETGTFGALGFGVAGLILGGVSRRRGRPTEPLLCYVIPLVLAAIVILGGIFGRVLATTADMSSTNPYYHQIGPSLYAALSDLPGRFVGTGGMGQDLAAQPGLVMRALLLAGFALLCRAAMPSRLPIRYAGIC